MTNELAHAVDKLTKPWTDVLTVEGEYRSVDYEPMLDMLRNAIHSSVGRTESGRSDTAARSVMNLRAFTLWERVDGQTRAWLGQLNTPAPKDLKAAVVALYVHVNNLWASQQITEPEYARYAGMLERWPEDIWVIFDPPVEKEIIGTCPGCGEKDYFGPEGERSAAIRAYYWRDVEPAAQCQRCAQEWKGRTQLIQLAYRIGATVDEDALRDMGEE
jgi:hypothetical protein